MKRNAMSEFDATASEAHKQSTVKKFKLLFSLILVMGVGYWIGGKETAINFLMLFIGFQIVNVIQELHYLSIRIELLGKKLDDLTNS